MRTCVRGTAGRHLPAGLASRRSSSRSGAADRLAALIEESGEPLAPERAAGALLALQRVPGELARRVLEEVVRDDARLVRHGDGRVGLVGLAPPPRRRWTTRRLTVVDLETTGVGRERAHRRDRRRAARGRRAGRDVLAPRRPGRPAAAAHHAAHGHPRARPGGRRAGAARRSPTSSRLARGSVLVAHNARFDVGFLDRALMRARRHAPRLARARHGGARAAAAGRPARALRPRHARPIASTRRAALPPCAARRPGHRRGAAAR